MTHKLDAGLITVIHEVLERDQTYRDENIAYYKDPILLKQQTQLDLENQRVIDSLYSVHKTYLGTSLVGTNYNYVMWLVIQHSNIGMMEQYLPIIAEAVKNNELNEGPLKVLIDRVYTVKYGYQVFGSQISTKIKLADEKTRQEVRLKYGID